MSASTSKPGHFSASGHSPPPAASKSKATSVTTSATPPLFYRLKTLKHVLDVSGSHVWAMVKAGTFPKPIKLSEMVTVWSTTEVEAWARARITTSQQKGVI